MKNHGLGTHSKKMSTGISQVPLNLFDPDLPKLANYLGYFWKKVLITCPLSMMMMVEVEEKHHISCVQLSNCFPKKLLGKCTRVEPVKTGAAVCWPRKRESNPPPPHSSIKYIYFYSLQLPV